MNTDEGPKPEWTTKELDYQLMTYTLKEASMVAERYGIKIGLEPHQQYSKSQEGLDSIYILMKSPAIGINYDTGNSNLAGTTDTYEWLNHVKDRPFICMQKISVFHKALRKREELPEPQWVAHAVMALWIEKK